MSTLEICSRISRATSALGILALASFGLACSGAGGGDSWEGEVPLGELTEVYRVTIYDGETPVRTAQISTPDYLYAAADILADFGSPDPGEALSFSVAQISDAVGEGIEASAAPAIAH